jgi:sugar transferase EpsL
MLSPVVKRSFDIISASVSLLLVAPILIIIGLTIRFCMGAPVFFRQERPGFRDKPFVMYKFRTMLERVGADGRPLPDKQRLTDLGRFLRSNSLDELPALINVLKGDMSLVGPRPLLMQYLTRYTPEQARRHEVKPGITGWAQVNGRNALTWEQKFEHDVWYVDHQSIWLDVKILALTLWKILRREGINQPGQATAEEFQGTIYP